MERDAHRAAEAEDPGAQRLLGAVELVEGAHDAGVVRPRLGGGAHVARRSDEEPDAGGDLERADAEAHRVGGQPGRRAAAGEARRLVDRGEARARRASQARRSLAPTGRAALQAPDQVDPSRRRDQARGRRAGERYGGSFAHRGRAASDEGAPLRLAGDFFFFCRQLRPSRRSTDPQRPRRSARPPFANGRLRCCRPRRVLLVSHRLPITVRRRRRGYSSRARKASPRASSPSTRVLKADGLVGPARSPGGWRRALHRAQGGAPRPGRSLVVGGDRFYAATARACSGRSSTRSPTGCPWRMSSRRRKRAQRALRRLLSRRPGPISSGSTTTAHAPAADAPRGVCPTRPSGFFLHVRSRRRTSSEPCSRATVARRALGADLVCFQAAAYLRNFAASAAHVPGCRWTSTGSPGRGAPWPSASTR